VCDRITAAISLGAISALISLVWLAGRFVVTKDYPSIVDAVVAAVLLALWTFGATYLTFDEEQSPAVAQGNLYFSTWSGWGLLVFLASKSFRTFWNVAPVAQTETETVDDRAAVAKTTIEHEPVPDLDADTHATHDENPPEVNV
jgi:hypothetical protein